MASLKTTTAAVWFIRIQYITEYSNVVLQL